MQGATELPARPLAYTNLLTLSHGDDRYVEMQIAHAGQLKHSVARYSDLEKLNCSRQSQHEMVSQLAGYEQLLRRVGRENARLKQQVAELHKIAIDDPAQVQIKLQKQQLELDRARLQAQALEIESKRYQTQIEELFKHIASISAERDDALRQLALMRDQLAQQNFEQRVREATRSQGRRIDDSTITRLADLAAKDAAGQ